MKDYGKALRILRKRAGTTQAQLAEKLNVTYQTVSKWENGVNTPDISSIEKICAFFSVSVEEYLRLVEDENDAEEVGAVVSVADESASQVRNIMPEQNSLPQAEARISENIVKNTDSQNDVGFRPAYNSLQPYNDISPASANVSAVKKRISDLPYIIVASVIAGVIVISLIIIGIVAYFRLSPTELSPIELSPSSIYEKVNRSVFYLEVKTESSTVGSSGFFIDDSGTAVTNYHSIKDLQSAQARLYDGKTYAVDKIIGIDSVHDVAVIHVDKQVTKAVKTGNGNNLQAGDTVYALGYPASFSADQGSTLTQGSIAEVGFEVNGIKYILSTVDITEGNSGGVLLDGGGRVIGITTAGIRSGNISYMNLSLPINVLSSVKRDLNMTTEKFVQAQKERHEVTYMLGDNVYATRKVNGLENVPQVKPVIENGTFEGWFDDKNFGKQHDFGKKLSSDIVLYGKCIYTEHNVKYDGGIGATGNMPSTTLREGTSITLASNGFRRVGYTFDGWIYNEKTYAPGDKFVVEGGNYTITLKAKWKPITYTVVYAYDGTEKSYTFTYGEKHTSLGAMSARTGYTQTAWQKNTQSYGLNTTLPDLTSTAGDRVVLTPVLTPITYKMIIDLNSYTAFFDGKMYTDNHYLGNTVEIECTYGEDPFDGHTASQYYMDFAEWLVYDENGEKYEGDLRYINPDPDIVVSAKVIWVSGTYRLDLYRDRFELIFSKELSGKEEYALPAAETLLDIPEGYSFLHWKQECSAQVGDERYIEDGATVSDLMIYGFFSGQGTYVELYAELAPNSYTVRFDGGDASGNMDDMTFTYDTKQKLPPCTFEKPGYLFAGWQIGDEIYYECSVVENLVTQGEAFLTARWVKALQGSGTEQDPYLISSADDLRSMAEIVDYVGSQDMYCEKKSYATDYYVLTDDIDFKGAEWEAMASVRPFCGVLDGNNHVIKNIAMTSSGAPYAFIARVFGGEIRNIGIENYEIRVSGSTSVAPLAYSYISQRPLYNCFAEGTITLENFYSGDVGGLVGRMVGTVENCYARNSINVLYTKSHGSSYMTENSIAGFVVELSGGTLVHYIYNAEGNVSNSMRCAVYSPLVKNCYAQSEIRHTYAEDLGYFSVRSNMGLFATKGASGAVYENCFAAGEIYSNRYYSDSFPFVNLFIGSNYYTEYKNVYVCGDIKFENNPDYTKTLPDGQQKTEIENLQSLSWLQTNMQFDADIWQEVEGELPKLKAFNDGVVLRQASTP